MDNPKNIPARIPIPIYILCSVVYFTQGFESLPSQGLFYYLKETLKFSPQKIMLISSVTTFAWLVKPFIGYFIDRFYSKRVWIILAVSLDIALALLIGLKYLPVIIIVGVLIVNSVNAALRDVAVDAMMCVEGKRLNATGRIQSVQWIALSVAGLLTGIGGGYIAEKSGYRMGFLCLIPIYFLVGVSAYYYRGSRQPGKKSHEDFISDLKKLFTSKKLLLVALFIFLYRYSPSFGTPLFFIQRDVFKWGKVWIGIVGTIGTLFGIIGSLLYYKFSRRINIKKWLYLSVFLGAVTTLTYLFYTPATAIIYDVIYGLLGMFIFLMVMDFMAQSTLPGLEATSFAFLCSASNLALVASNLSGAVLLPVIGLKWLIVLSSLTSFLCLPLIYKINWKMPVQESRV